jgi:Fe2+ transport system protein FeoA
VNSLGDMPPGTSCRVRGFSPQVRPEVSRRLRELGFGQGDLVRCLRAAPLGGPRVFAVSGCAFALESELAAQVLVTSLESHGDG